jgi:hypothetical protein
MDWNVSPDDERQFDEFFKDERPSSATSNSSTSTDTTHLESILGEPIEDPEASISQVTDASDSSRNTPTQETMSSEVQTVGENEAEKDLSCQTAIESRQETGDHKVLEEAVGLPETKGDIKKNDIHEISPIPAVAEEETVVAEEILHQIPEPSNKTVINDSETIKLVASEEKIRR